MTWTAMSTQVTGYVVQKTEWNKIPPNFDLTVPGLVTTLGDIGVATGANATKRLAAFDGSDTIIQEAGGVQADISAISTGGILVGQSAGVIGIETPMSQAQAEAGSETQVRGITAQRVGQAIAAITPTGFSAVGFAQIQMFSVGND